MAEKPIFKAKRCLMRMLYVLGMEMKGGRRKRAADKYVWLESPTGGGGSCDRSQPTLMVGANHLLPGPERR